MRNRVPSRFNWTLQVTAVRQDKVHCVDMGDKGSEWSEREAYYWGAVLGGTLVCWLGVSAVMLE